MTETKLNKKNRSIEVYEDGELIKIFLAKYKSEKKGKRFINYVDGKKSVRILVDNFEPVLEETDKIKLIRNFSYNPNTKEIEVISKNGDEIIHKNANKTDWEILSGEFHRDIFYKVLIVILIISFIYFYYTI